MELWFKGTADPSEREIIHAIKLNPDLTGVNELKFIWV
jgi:hypothetical protein